MTRAAGPLCALLLVLVAAVPARSADDADKGAVLRTRGALLASQGHCDQALPLLARARSLAPGDARAALIEGQCLFQARRYSDAVAPLKDAARLAPESGEAALYLGMAQYHSGDSAAAAESLERAEAQLPDSAEAALYRGLALLDLARHDEASERLGRASTIDPAHMEPMASYYAGLAHRSAGRAREAETALMRVSELAPGSEWDREAQAALADDAPAARYDLRRWLVLRAGLSYDSNVALVGNDVARPDFVSGRRDGRGEWAVEGGAELFRNDRWGVGALADYYGNAYFRESEFDQAFAGAGFWVDHRAGENTVLRLQPQFGARFYDYEDFLRFYGATGEWFQSWGEGGSGTLWVRYSWNDFLYPVPGPTASLRDVRNRDGHDVRGGYDHSWPITTSTTLEGGPFFRVYDSEGSEWDQWGVGGFVGVVQQLPWQLLGQASFSYAYDSYDNPSTFQQPGESSGDRRDDIYWFQVSLERPITERIVATARWSYVDNDSNTRIFDYDRHIVGLYLSVALGD